MRWKESEVRWKVRCEVGGEVRREVVEGYKTGNLKVTGKTKFSQKYKQTTTKTFSLPAS